MEGIVYYNPIEDVPAAGGARALLGFVSAGILLITAGDGAGLVAAIDRAGGSSHLRAWAARDLLRQILIR